MRQQNTLQREGRMQVAKVYKGQWCFIEPRICEHKFCDKCAIYLKISRVFTSWLEEKAKGVEGALDRMIKA
jgi:hypothetical protein